MAVIQIKRGTAADWLAANPVLALGELGLETDTNKLKAGNGTSSWYELQYIAGSGGGGGGAVTSVNAKTGDVVLVKADLGLSDVDNTSDAAKPISAATQIALDGKVDDAELVALDAKVDTKAAQTDLDALAGRVGTNEGDISTKIGAVVEDTTPQLGGDLDVQNFIISSSVDDVQFASDVVPLQDGQTDLGSATNKWRDVYVEDGVAFTDKRTNDESILSIRDGQLIVTDSTQEVTTAVDLGGTTPDPGHIRNVELDGTGRYAAGTSTLFNTNGLVTREFINSPGQFFVINDIDGGVFTGGNRQGFGLVRETMVDGTDLSGQTAGVLTGGNSGGCLNALGIGNDSLTGKFLGSGLGQGLTAGLLMQLLAGNEDEGDMRSEFERRPFGYGGPGGRLGGITYANMGGEMGFPRRNGGIMPNEGIPNQDSVRAMLMPGEFVMTTDAVKGLGNGSMNQGIKNMYSVMRGLENKGRATA